MPSFFSRTDPDGVPLTIAPDQDVIVPLGRPLAELRSGLAECTGRPELATAPLFVGNRQLDAHHMTGHPPLLPGAVLSTVASPRDPAERALDAVAHIAVLAGQDGGTLLALDTTAQRFPTLGVAVRVRPTRGNTGRNATDRDNMVRVQVRRDSPRTPRSRRFPWPGPTASIRQRGSETEWPQLVSGRGRCHRVRRRWRPWAPGVVLSTGRTRAQLRCRPVLTDWAIGALVPALAAHPSVPDPVGEHAGTPHAAMFAPAVGSLGLALALRNPLIALMALTTPLMILAPWLTRRIRRRKGSPDRRPAKVRPLRPDILRRPPDLLRAGVCPVAGLHPVDLLTAATAAAMIPESAVPGRYPTEPPGHRTEQLAPARLGDLPDGALAITGDRQAALALAQRTVVSLHAFGRARVTILSDEDTMNDWVWTRWLPGTRIRHSLEGLETGEGQLLVVDYASLDIVGPDVGAWHASQGNRAAVLIICAGPVPSWCSSRAVALHEGTTWTTPGRPDSTSPPETHADTWFEDYARRIAGLIHRRRWVSMPEDGDAPSLLPSSAALADDPGLDNVVGRWQSSAARRHTPGGGLAARIGIGADGRAVVVNLVRDGPHALVAGTTGSGKSELLQTLVLSLALTYSPDDLAIALVDYKGGTSFGACADLPHVVGQVTDLDPGAAARALAGLQAELHRRERLVANAGVTSLHELYARDETQGRDLPRLLVVVDEFRALADDQPDFIPGLVRIAAQGRSLGIHLILATQRPSGAVTADMRANISLRIALRVVDTADSRDVIDSGAAALISPQTPGRALLRRGLADPEPLQAFYAGAAPRGTAVSVRHASLQAPSSAPPRVKKGAEPGLVGMTPRSLGWKPPVAASGTPEDGAVRRLVDLARNAMSELNLPPPRVPWMPDLPAVLPWERLDVSPLNGLALALTDRPHEQCQVPFSWDPSTGHLIVLGRARSGRTTALRALAHAGVRAGLTVHVVGSDDLAAGLNEPGPAQPGTRRRQGGLGTVVSRADPRRLARLLTLLGSGPPGVGTIEHLVLVDGLEDIQPALGMIRRGAGLDLLTSALRDGLSRGVAFAVAGAVQPPTTIAALLTLRIVLSGSDTQDDLVLGVPKALAGRGGIPGRAVLQVGGSAVRCQIAMPPSASTPPEGMGSSGRVTSSARVVPIPHRVDQIDLLAEHNATGTGTIPLGIGGDDGSVVELPAVGSLLVCGPHGSGRTTVLRHVANAAASDGLLLGLIGREPALCNIADRVGAPTVSHLSSAAADTWIAQVSEAAPGAACRSRPRVIVDDLDAFALACPLAADRLHGLLETGVDIVASATTAAAAGSFRGLLAELRATRRGVVLTPSTVGSSEVFGVDLGWLVEPGVDVPGRGAVINERDAALLQVAWLPNR